MTKFTFAISLLFILYTYAGYPLILYIWSKLFPHKIFKAYPDPHPFVSVIIAARNEQDNIARRIENLFLQNYPASKMEIIIISDGSKDLTNDIITDYIEEAGAPDERDRPGLKLITHDENRGKPAAINAGFNAAAGEYIILTDTRQEFEPDAIKELIANFNDPGVGTVSGELFFKEDSVTNIKSEMKFHWTLEKWIRKAESRIHSTAGATGGIYAIRRELAESLPENVILDDVMIPMRGVLKGYRTVFENRAIAWDILSKNMAREKKRKVRTLLGNYQLLQVMPSLMSARKNPIFFQFLSHKFFRLLVPFFFILMMLSSLMTGEAVYRSFFLICSAILFLPLLTKHVKNIPLLGKICLLSKTFTTLNYFALLAFLAFIKPGGKKDVWQ